MIRKNNKYNVFYGYEDGQKVYVIRPKTYLNYLEFLTDNNDCIENYKFCGILDTYGNKFCFPKFILQFVSSICSYDSQS